MSNPVAKTSKINGFIREELKPALNRTPECLGIERKFEPQQ